MQFTMPNPILYQALTQGLVIGFATAAMISPVNFMVLRRGILGGFQSAWFAGFGAAFMDALIAYLVFGGVVKVGFVGTWKILAWGGGAVALLYIGYSVLTEIRENPSLAETVHVKAQTAFLDKSFIMGVLLVGTNPFSLFFWIVMVSTLHLSTTVTVDPTGQAATTFFSAVLVGETGWYSLLSFAVHKTRNLFNRVWLSWISLFSGLGLLGFVLFMAVKAILHLIRHGGAPYFPT